jgi:hypothetical protein
MKRHKPDVTQQVLSGLIGFLSGVTFATVTFMATYAITSAVMYLAHQL